MNVIPTRVHGILDYATALALIVLPFLFPIGAGAGGVEAAAAEARNPYTVAGWFLVGPGLALLGLSLITRYELGAVKSVQMPVHLATDVGLGLFLIASPWLFSFADAIWWPHVLVGLVEVGAGLLTRKRSPMEGLHRPAEAMVPRHWSRGARAS